MANQLFLRGRQAFLDGEVAFSTDNIKLVDVDHGVDTPNPATDEDLADIIAGARIATSANFAGKTSTGGTADANDVTISAVSGNEFESVDIYFDSGVEATSWLLVFIDTATGLPFTPNGGDITHSWDNGTDKIFTL
jgi:hypothetical protein